MAHCCRGASRVQEARSAGYGRPRSAFLEIKALDADLIERLHSHAARLQERADNVCNIARSVMRATNEISQTEIERPVIFGADSEPFDVKTAHFEPWEAIIREILTEDASGDSQ
ncbi:hypothetical protein [Tardiphaga sp. 813_E8_N1_3]|uniref:hypothetical protein n=1 Tax=Tardiphaga sp. 813_E8_N1_3 TaxID=3240760 RepID=UPI003F285E4D